jgi:hypothetical protein
MPALRAHQTGSKRNPSISHPSRNALHHSQRHHKLLKLCHLFTHPEHAIWKMVKDRERFIELSYQELDIQAQLKKDIPVNKDGLDFSEYDKLMNQLRQVRAEMASLVN